MYHVPADENLAFWPKLKDSKDQHQYLMVVSVGDSPFTSEPFNILRSHETFLRLHDEVHCKLLAVENTIN